MTPQEFKARRLRLGLSQTALGDRFGLSKQTIIRMEDERGEGPPPLAALAITALDVPGDPGAELDLKLELHGLAAAVLRDRNADAAVESLDEIERILAKRRPTAMGYETAAREARKIAFEHLISEIGGDEAPTTIDYRTRLAQALLGTSDGAGHGLGLASIKFNSSTPPPTGGLANVRLQEIKLKR